MTKGEYEVALGQFEVLMDASQLAPGERDRLDELATLIEAYELEHFPIPDPTPEEAAAFRREQENGDDLSR